jgi:hypothetical protein
MDEQRRVGAHLDEQFARVGLRNHGAEHVVHVHIRGGWNLPVPLRRAPVYAGRDRGLRHAWNANDYVYAERDPHTDAHADGHRHAHEHAHAHPDQDSDRFADAHTHADHHRDLTADEHRDTNVDPFRHQYDIADRDPDRHGYAHPDPNADTYANGHRYGHRARGHAHRNRDCHNANPRNHRHRRAADLPGGSRRDGTQIAAHTGGLRRYDDRS